MYAEYLRFAGFRVEEAEDGDRAVALAITLLPRVILMDLSMPGLDGWKATRALKSDPRTRAIPIIALTAHAFPSEQARALDAGCDGVLAKPCSPSAVADRVRDAIERGRRASGTRPRVTLGDDAVDRAARAKKR